MIASNGFRSIVFASALLVIPAIGYTQDEGHVLNLVRAAIERGDHAYFCAGHFTIDSIQMVRRGNDGAIRTQLFGTCGSVFGSRRIGVIADYWVQRNDFGEIFVRRMPRQSWQVTSQQIPSQTESVARAPGANSSPLPSGRPSPLMMFGNEWIGSWRSFDGERMMNVSQNTVRIVDRDGQSESARSLPPINLRRSADAYPQEDHFSYGYLTITHATIAKRYESALQQARQDPVGFRVTEPESGRQAIALIAPGSYRVLRAKVGPGDCGATEWIVYISNMLEIRECKYEFLIRVLASQESRSTAVKR